MNDSSLNFWPTDNPPAVDESVRVTCDGCLRPWQVHVDLSGYAFRCKCQQSIRVPWREGVLPEDEVGQVPAISAKHDFTIVRSGGAPLGLEDDEVREYGMQLASNQLRNRITSRAVLELTGIMFAFLLPANIAFLCFGAGEYGRLLPFASLVSALLILAISATSLTAAMSAFCRARLWYFLEASAVAVIGFLLALGYTHLLPDDLSEGVDSLFQDMGLPMAIFAVGVVPGIFEEIAFRGIVQSRLKVLFGIWAGVLVSAMAFALAHGVTLGLPFHFGLGIYLAFLRERSGSLIPGMLCHFAYNTSLVVASSLDG